MGAYGGRFGAYVGIRGCSRRGGAGQGGAHRDGEDVVASLEGELLARDREGDGGHGRDHGAVDGVLAGGERLAAGEGQERSVGQRRRSGAALAAAAARVLESR